MTTAGASPVPSGLFVDAWSTSLPFALVVGGGLAPALRGAALGLDTWIERLDSAAGVASQFAALVTFFLIVHYAIACIRFARPLWQMLPLILGAAMVSVLLVSSQQITLGRETAIVGTFSAALVAGVSAAKLLTRARSSSVLLSWIGAFLALELVGMLSLPEAPPGVIGPIRWLCSLIGLAAAVRLLVRTSPRPRWLLGGLLGVGVLCALLVRAATVSGTTPAAITLGRALRSLGADPWEVVPPAVHAALLGVGLGGLAVALGLRLTANRRGAASTLLGVVGALLLQVQPTPLTLGAFCLVSLALVADAHPPDSPAA